MEEIWKDIKGYEGDYQVSNFGRAKSYKRYKEGKIMKSSFDKDGYLIIGFNKNNKQKTYKTHRIVAQAFLGLDIDDKTKMINHKNHIVSDNRIENLEIVNIRENSSYRLKKTTSRFIGAKYHKRDKKWESFIRINNKDAYLGRFNTEEEAHQAYLKALIDYGIENKYAERIKETI